MKIIIFCITLVTLIQAKTPNISSLTNTYKKSEPLSFNIISKQDAYILGLYAGSRHKQYSWFWRGYASGFFLQVFGSIPVCIKAGRQQNFKIYGPSLNPEFAASYTAGYEYNAKKKNKRAAFAGSVAGFMTILVPLFIYFKFYGLMSA